MSKPRKHIILRITNQGVFYNEQEYIPWENTNFPPKRYFNFNERLIIYWRAEMVSFKKTTYELELKVLDYEVIEPSDKFKSQERRNPLRQLRFQLLRWFELEKIMNIFTRSKFVDISDAAILITEENFKKSASKSRSGHQGAKADYSRKYKLKVQHSLMKTTFKMGYVELDKRIKGIPGRLKLILENSHIIPEFDHVKPFFAKIIGKKKIEISVTVIIDEDGEKTIHCRSNDIDQINEEVITGVKRLRLKESIIRPKIITVDKSLFTPDEFFDSSDKEELGNSLRIDEKDLFNEIMGLDEIRNKKQLIYLSGKLQSNKTRLKFTLSPKFGFLFHVQGQEMDHFIWELLNTHATYIWSIDKQGLTIERIFQLMELQINFIRDNGRRLFLSNKDPSDFIFNKVNHESSGSHLKDGFPKWKARVNELIV